MTRRELFYYVFDPDYVCQDKKISDLWQNQNEVISEKPDILIELQLIEEIKNPNPRFILRLRSFCLSELRNTSQLPTLIPYYQIQHIS